LREYSGSAAASLSEDNFLLLLNELALRHKVVAVRLFGDSWVGCIGFFDSWGSESLDCLHIVQFACEMSMLEKSVLGEVAIAVEFGNIVGGFLDSLCFDLFGQEIRWLLMMAELTLAGKVIVGDAIKHKLNSSASRRNSTDFSAIGVFDSILSNVTTATTGRTLMETNQLAVHPPWKLNSTIVVHYIVNSNVIVNITELQFAVQEFAIKNGMQRCSMVFKEDSIDCDLAMNYMGTTSDIFDEDNRLEQQSEYSSKQGENMSSMSYMESLLKSHYPQYEGLYHRLFTSEHPSRMAELEKALWKEDIGI